MAILERFDSLRTELAQSLSSLQGIVAGSPHPDARLEQSLCDIRERLAVKRFVLVVLGEFKRGKTTLINSLIGEELLPTAVVPLTSVATVLKYGSERRAQVQFLDGTARSVPVEEIAAYVTERENPGNRKQVAQVHVWVPCEFLKGGVELVDTPGVGSVYAHNTRAAYEFVPQADAGIFVVTADPPISEGERRFLADVRPFLARLFFVQNKIDQVAPKEQAESLTFTREVIERETGVPDLVIYPLSAREALEAKQYGDRGRLERSGLAAFEAALSQFLMSEKGDIVLGSSLKHALHLAVDRADSLQLRQQALRAPLAALEKAAETFHQESRAIREEQRSARALLWTEAERTIIGRSFEEAKEQTRQALLQAIMGHVRDAVEPDNRVKDNADLGPAQLLVAINETTGPAVERGVLAWQARTEPELEAAVHQLCEQFTERINEIVERMLSRAGQVFNVPLRLLVPPPPLETVSQFVLREWAVTVRLRDVGGVWLYLLPRAVARRRILRGAERKIAVGLDLHLALVAADLRDRVRASIDAYLHAMNDAVAATIAGIEEAIQRAMEQKTQGEAVVARSLDELAREATAVVEAQQRLRVLLDRWGASTHPFGAGTRRSGGPDGGAADVLSAARCGA